MRTPIRLQHTVLVIALASIYPLQATAAVSAGVAQFTAGDVNVRRPDGGVAPLSKGKDIESGESIVTGVNGRAQVKFTDGGLISLQPNTEFKIANYSDNAANPKEERFLVDLLRGSMRAITGLIGKRNRENYKVNTATATIGIRGSGFNVGYNPDGSLGVTTELDAIEVCNAGGCVGLTAGESVRVVSSNEAPVRTNVKATIPTPGPERDPVVVGDKVNSEGKASIVPEQETKKTVEVNSGTFTNLKIAATGFLPGMSGPSSGGVPTVVPQVATSATLVDGKLTKFILGSDAYLPSTTNGVSSVGSLSAGDFIGWGTWVTSSKNGGTAVANLHYVVGQPTVNMPTTAGVLTYTLTGASPVTSYVNSTGVAGASGTLTSASLFVNFSNSKMGASINTTLGNISIASTAMMISGSQFSYSSGTGIYVDGFFAGVNAARAGIVYTAPVLSTGSFSGAATFKAP
ncbi:MAG: FecR family protein [Pseudomonadota bacterium]